MLLSECKCRVHWTSNIYLTLLHEKSYISFSILFKFHIFFHNDECRKCGIKKKKILFMLPYGQNILFILVIRQEGISAGDLAICVLMITDEELQRKTKLF